VILKIRQLINKYNNKERVCGSLDCILMILELHEPEFFDKLDGQFDSIPSGVKAAKKHIGYTSIKDILESNPDKYYSVPPKFAKIGDIGLVKDSYCVFLHLGDKLFGVRDKEDKQIFMISDLNVIDEDNHSFYRRK